MDIPEGFRARVNEILCAEFNAATAKMDAADAEKKYWDTRLELLKKSEGE